MHAWRFVDLRERCNLHSTLEAELVKTGLHLSTSRAIAK